MYLICGNLISKYFINICELVEGILWLRVHAFVLHEIVQFPLKNIAENVMIIKTNWLTSRFRVAKHFPLFFFCLSCCECVPEKLNYFFIKIKNYMNVRIIVKIMEIFIVLHCLINVLHSFLKGKLMHWE